MMATTPTNEQGKPLGHVYVDITLTNLFSNKSIEVHALVDTGTFLSVIPVHIAIELGFDPEEMSTRLATLADGSLVERPAVPLEVRFQDRRTTCDALVMGNECMVGVLALEAMAIVVDPVRQCVIPDPKQPDGPIQFPGKAEIFRLFAEEFNRRRPL
jgi:clan AA aspartic protease